MPPPARAFPRTLPALLLLAGAWLSPSPAFATLTDSEKAQIRDFYANGEASTAPRVRALLARPDLTPAEIADAFSDATRRVPFDERRQLFVKDLLFGPATEASRSELVPPVVIALLARSAEVAGAPAGEAARADELLRIHRFVGREIASAGKPPAGGHDAAAAIRDDALAAVAAAYKAHLALPVLDRARLTGALTIARAQAELTLVELAAGIHPRGDVAAWIGADAQEGAALERTGVFVAGLAGAPPGKAAAVVRMLETVEPLRRGASALWVGKPWPKGLSARRGLLVAQAPLGGTRRADPSRLWSSSVEPSTPDAALAEIAFVIARAGAVELAASDGAFAAAQRDALERARAGGDAAFLPVGALAEALDRDETGGTNVAVAPDGLTAHAARLLLLDAPRALSVALVRSLGGRNEPFEQLALALGLLATGADGKLKEAVVLGRAGDAGGIAPVEVTGIRGTAAAIERFTIDGHEIAITRGAGVTGVTRDGKVPTLATTPFARVPTTGGETWTRATKGGKSPGETIKRLFGRPEVGLADDGRILVRSVGAGRGRDAVVIERAEKELTVELDAEVTGAPAAIVLRAAKSPTGYSGVAIVLEPDGGKATVVALDGAGAKIPLGAPLLPGKPGPRGLHVKARCLEGKVDVTVGAQSLSAPLPDAAANLSTKCDVAFAPGDRGELTVRRLKIGAAGKR